MQHVSRTVWSPGEKVGPMTVREPVYRVDVKLDSQSVAVGAQTLALRPGMSVNADILQEKRKVLGVGVRADPVAQGKTRLNGALH